MALSALFIVIAILLINSSIRLSVYSKRMIIKTMQLVGATKSFIRRHLSGNIAIGGIRRSFGLWRSRYLLLELNERFPN